MEFPNADVPITAMAIAGRQNKSHWLQDLERRSRELPELICRSRNTIPQAPPIILHSGGHRNPSTTGRHYNDIWMAFPLSSRRIPDLRRALLLWYDTHHRDLPWRREPDPYRVWVSEIMLQQTRVAAVLEHYARWMQRFPTVQDLAKAREQSVLALWSGLGYYHRARRLHQAAKVIVRERKGEFPTTAEGWREHPGIGRYTAAAIASIAFGEPVALVDGNVERVLDRMFGLTDKQEGSWQRAEALLDRSRPGDFNQAMMELGATICTPRVPQCLICPLHHWCQSRGAEVAKAQPARKRRHLHYALASDGGSALLVQRPHDVRRMAGMWELPELLTVPDDKPLASFRHSITDTDYAVAIHPAPEAMIQSVNGNARWFSRKQWEKMALTGLTRKVLRKLVPAT
jgi:A/G-specific adenine glycosylase